MHQEQKLDEKQKIKVTLLQNFQSELQEASAQTKKLLESLKSLQEILNNMKNSDANLDKFDNELQTKIKNFTSNIEEFQKRNLDINRINVEMTIEEIIQKCQQISDKMNQFYKVYQILWTQCYYQRLRRQLTQNDLKQEQSELISQILS